MSYTDDTYKEGTIYVSFGPKPTQVLSLDVASDVLTLWREREAARFGAYLAEVMTGAKPRSARG